MKAIKSTGTRNPWSAAECKQCISLYALMLAAQRLDKKYVKAPMVRTLAAGIGRTKGSVEAKLMNISGVRHSIGLDYVTGYKPLGNAQKLLADMVKEASK